MSNKTGNCATYSYDYDAYVCIDADGKLSVYWDKLTGCDDYYELVVEENNWDGSTVSGSFNDDFCSSGSNETIGISVTRVDANTVNVAWSVNTSGCSCDQLSANSPIGDNFNVDISEGACTPPQNPC